MRVSLGLAMAVIMGCAGVLRAEPADLKQVGADAKWMIQVDFDALLASTIFHKAYERAVKNHPEIEEHLAKMRDRWQFDPKADLHGLTLYGRQFKHGEGVAIVHAKVDQDLLLEKAKEAPGHKASAHGKYELHTWTHAEGSKRQRSMTGVFYKPDVLVFGSSEAEVAAALDVLDGTKPNMAGEQSSLGTIPAGTILFADARDVSEIKVPAQSPAASVVKQADTLRLALGEYQGNVFFSGSMKVKEAKVAQELKTIAEGFRAAASLKNLDDPAALKIIDALKVSAADKTLTVEWSAPADAVWSHVEKHWGEMCRHFGHRGEGPWHHPSGK